MSTSADEPDEDERGYFTLRFDGGPGTAGSLAQAVRIAARKDWPSSPDMQAFLTRFAAALDAAEFTPVRNVEIRQRSPQEVRERLLSSPLPPELAEALADELDPL